MYYEKTQNSIYFDKNQLEIICLEQLVPEDHLLRKIEKCIDFEFIHDYTKQYYSQDTGRPCLDTVTLFKIVILSFLVGRNSIRGILEETKVNMAYRWFLNLSLTGSVPNYSTFSQNYIRRYKDTEVFNQIFNKIIDSLIENKLIDPSIIFVDGTHIKANANKKKFFKKEVIKKFSNFEKEIQKEINDYRKEIGKKEFDYNDDDDDNTNDGNQIINEETGEVTKNKDNDHVINISTVDPDSGMFVKGEHERQFAYVDQVACDKHGYVVSFDVNPANMHDSKAFIPFLREHLLRFKPEVVCGDAAYINTNIAKAVLDENIKLLAPYVRPKGQYDSFNNEFKYQLEANAYLCPNKELLHLNNIDRHGYMLYTIESHHCEGCPFKDKCLRNYKMKVIRRHINQDYLDECKQYRLSDEGKELYTMRKETIERVFADAKEKNGLRFTRFKGRVKNRHLRCLLYACLNMKKVAIYLSNKATKCNKLCMN